MIRGPFVLQSVLLSFLDAIGLYQSVTDIENLIFHVLHRLHGRLRMHLDNYMADAPSAALHSGGAHGWRVDGGLQRGPVRDGTVIALFGPRPDLVGWAATIEGRPSEQLLANVRHFQPYRSDH